MVHGIGSKKPFPIAKSNPSSAAKARSWGREVVVAITRGKLDPGPWEQIFYGEFDGKRRRRVLVRNYRRLMCKLAYGVPTAARKIRSSSMNPAGRTSNTSKTVRSAANHGRWLLRPI